MKTPTNRGAGHALPRVFFQRDPVACARELIGATLHWQGLQARIVETEAYAAVGDEACHTWNRPSARAFIATHPPGAAYVYLNYGIHWMLNILIKGGSMDGFVLFRALEPLVGHILMRDRRSQSGKPSEEPRWLCGGPGRLAQALGVAGTHHGLDFCEGGDCYITPAHRQETVIACPRIGISRACELPWRFVLADSACLSVPPQKKKPG